MNQSQPKPKKAVNTLSVRLPPDLYNVIAEMALERGDTLNSVFTEMVQLGLDRKAHEELIIQNFVMNIIPQERLKELINGRPQGTVTT